MERADSCIILVIWVKRDLHVSSLRMNQSMKHLIVQNHSDSDASANCNIYNVSMGIIVTSEVRLKLGNHIDVSIEHNLKVATFPLNSINHGSQQIKVLPFNLGSGGHITIVR